MPSFLVFWESLRRLGICCVSELNQVPNEAHISWKLFADNETAQSVNFWFIDKETENAFYKFIGFRTEISNNDVEIFDIF